MNELFITLGIESWKPYVTALVMPPLPFLVLVLAGARLMFRRRALAWLLVLLGVAGLWLMCTTAASHLMLGGSLQPPPVLRPEALADLKRSPRTAIVVLGGGRRTLAPEYGVATLNARSVERLRYGVWLSRETGLPLAFSGGVGHGARPGPSEAEVAARVAERDFNRPLRWLETESRDTRENAQRTVALLRPQGIDHIVLVTHADHMRRALRNFERAGQGMTITPAPMAVPPSNKLRATDWLPSSDGFDSTLVVLHEWLGLLAGA